jgi:hypothetical protein
MCVHSRTVRFEIRTPPSTCFYNLVQHLLQQQSLIPIWIGARACYLLVRPISQGASADAFP